MTSRGRKDRPFQVFASLLAALALTIGVYRSTKREETADVEPRDSKFFATAQRRRGELVPTDIGISTAPANDASRAALAVQLCREAQRHRSDSATGERNQRCANPEPWTARARASDTDVAQVTPTGQPDVRILGICKAGSRVFIVYHNSGAQVPGTVDLIVSSILEGHLSNPRGAPLPGYGLTRSLTVEVPLPTRTLRTRALSFDELRLRAGSSARIAVAVGAFSGTREANLTQLGLSEVVTLDDAVSCEGPPPPQSRSAIELWAQLWQPYRQRTLSAEAARLAARLSCRSNLWAQTGEWLGDEDPRCAEPPAVERETPQRDVP